MEVGCTMPWSPQKIEKEDLVVTHQKFTIRTIEFHCQSLAMSILSLPNLGLFTTRYFWVASKYFPNVSWYFCRMHCFGENKFTYESQILWEKKPNYICMYFDADDESKNFFDTDPIYLLKDKSNFTNSLLSQVSQTNHFIYIRMREQPSH